MNEYCKLVNTFKRRSSAVGCGTTPPLKLQKETSQWPVLANIRGIRTKIPRRPMIAKIRLLSHTTRSLLSRPKQSIPHLLYASDWSNFWSSARELLASPHLRHVIYVRGLPYMVIWGQSDLRERIMPRPSKIPATISPPLITARSRGWSAAVNGTKKEIIYSVQKPVRYAVNTNWIIAKNSRGELAERMSIAE